MRVMTFQCPKHGQFEVELEYGQDAPIWCPIYKEGTKIPCGERLKKIYDTPNIRFVGSGFTRVAKEK